MSRIYRTLGTVAMTPKGEYDSSAYYEKLNVVTYNGSSYVAIQNTHGNLPTNTTYWQLLAQKGAKTYDNVVEMKADTDLKNGMTARTLGYTTINDGGGALYKITNIEDNTIEQIELNNGLYANYINESLVVSIENYDGETAEERLFKALDDISYGTIICGKVEINNVYNAKAKDYRNITILGATLDIKIDYWFNQANSLYKSVPLFKSCSIKGNGHIMYNNNYDCIGPMFNGCDINNLCVYSNENYYVQSLYVIGCTLNQVHNFLTAKQVYDMKITNTRVESADGKLIVLTGNESILQSTISNSLIEGRNDVVIEYVSAYKFVIENCYFESNLQGLINQIGSNKVNYITVDNNVFFGNLTANAEINFETNSSLNQSKVTNNLSNIANGKLLCNKNLGNSQLAYITPKNTNYAHVWKNNGFALTGNRFYEMSEDSTAGTWDSSDSSWNYSIVMPFAEYYSWAHPFYVIFSGCFGSSSVNYQGFAILRITPRVGYSSENGVHNIVDCTIVDSCNKSNVIKASDVTASATLSSTSPGATTLTIDVKINGFNSTRGVFKVLDLYTIIDVITKY